jgi:hypothetical protein
MTFQVKDFFGRIILILEIQTLTTFLIYQKQIFYMPNN